MEENKTKTGKLYVETIVGGYNAPLPPNAFTYTDAWVAVYICTRFDEATRATWKKDTIMVLQFPDKTLAVRDDITLTSDEIDVSLRKFKKFHVNHAVDVIQSRLDGRHPLHIALAPEHIFALEKLFKLIIETYKKPTGRIFPEKRAKETLLAGKKLTAQPEAFTLLDAICEHIPPENIHKRPTIKAEMRSPRGWECHTTDNPERFIATIYLTATEKLFAVLPLLDKLEAKFREKSFKCAVSVYNSRETNHQVLQVEYDLASLRKLDVKEMSRHVNNAILHTKIPRFNPTQQAITTVPHPLTQQDMLVLKFVLSQSRNSAKDEIIHLFYFGRGDCLKTQKGGLTLTHDEICEIFRKLRSTFRDELADHMQHILDLLNAEKTKYQKMRFVKQCAESDIFDKYMAQLLAPYAPLCTDLSSVMVLSTQQLNTLKPFLEANSTAFSNLGEIIHVRAKEGLPSRVKMVTPTDSKEIFEILEQLGAPIPSQNIYLRQSKNRSERGWECYVTDAPNLFVATLYFTGVTSIKYLATLFQSHDIPAGILTFQANGQNYPTLGIAFDMQSLRSLDIATLRGEIDAFIKLKPAAISGAPHATQFTPAAVDRNAEGQQPQQSGKSSQQKKPSKK